MTEASRFVVIIVATSPLRNSLSRSRLGSDTNMWLEKCFANAYANSTLGHFTRVVRSRTWRKIFANSQVRESDPIDPYAGTGRFGNPPLCMLPEHAAKYDDIVAIANASRGVVDPFPIVTRRVGAPHHEVVVSSVSSSGVRIAPQSTVLGA